MFVDFPSESFTGIPPLKVDGNTLTMDTDKAVSKSCFYHIRALKQIRGSLDDATLCTVATALVSSRLAPSYMEFQLNTSVISSAHKIPLHVLSQVLASLTPAHPLLRDSIGSPSTLV